MPEQIPRLAPELKKMGLSIDPARLADLTGDPMGAIVSLGGCSASFVSPRGLVVTNHHCVYGYLQFNSTPGKNLLENGFLARTPGEEVPASPDARVFVTLSIEDATEAILGGEEGISDRERFERVERRRKETVRECEKEPGVRCLVPAFFEGTRYWKIRQLEVRDVRLVYAPARGIGNYGGEVDNWMWPRHTGDFAFLRAYVGPDGRPADFAKENVPYRPRRVLKVSSADVDPGDLVLVVGYPGKTYRYRLPEEVRATQEFELPVGIRYRRDLIGILESAGRGKADVQIRNASRIRGLANFQKKYEGTLEGFANGDLIGGREAELKEIEALAAKDPSEKRRFERTMEEMARLSAIQRKTRERDSLLWWLIESSPILAQANSLLVLSRERERDDAERMPGFQERDWKKLKAYSERVQRTIDPGSDRATLRYFLLEATKLPAGQRIPGVDEALRGTGEKGTNAQVERLLDRLYAGTKVGDLETRRAMFEETAGRLTARDDSMIGFAAALRKTIDEKKRRDDEIEGAMLRLRGTYVGWLQKVRTGRVYPDANGTLRVGFGRIAGYSPRDSVSYTPQTTLGGLLAKQTGKDPFDPPALLLAANGRGGRGAYRDPELEDVPVNFLSEGDVTNGSSGSATLNAAGELCGLAFDGNYESMGSDYHVNPDVTRTIHVDSRYMLWVMDAVDGAHNLLREMGLPVHFTDRGGTTSRTAASAPVQ